MSIPAPQMVKEIQEKTGVPPWLQYIGSLLIALYGIYQGVDATTRSDPAKAIDEKVGVVHRRIGEVDDRVQKIEINQAVFGVKLDHTIEAIKAAAPSARAIPEPNYQAVAESAAAEVANP